MDKNSFKKLFLLNVYVISLLLLGCTAFSTNFSSDEEYENIKILITSSEGLQFSKEDSDKGKKIIYDCELGLKNMGTIYIFDRIHPNDMRSLIIKNCYEITLSLSRASDFNIFQELQINNVTTLKLVTSYSWETTSSFMDLKVSINNVRFLDVDDFFTKITFQKFSLKLKNVFIDTLPKGFCNHDIGLLTLHLKNVEVKEIATGAIHLTGNSNSFLIVEDSHFEYVHRNAFVSNGTVNIINNTFSFLDESAFSIHTTTPFVFSGNHVKRMLNPFYIGGLEVNIINNFFDSILLPWLPKIIEPNIKSFRVLNVTGNIIHQWSNNIFYMEPQNFPDVIIFEDNYLNCSCKNAITLAYKFENYIPQVFLRKGQKNFCYNLGNCPLHKALEKGSDICSTTFRCPEDDQNEDVQNAPMWPSHIKSILSVLKNIDIKLDQIVSKYNSSLVDKQN